jgi:hypothetical protein
MTNMQVLLTLKAHPEDEGNEGLKKHIEFGQQEVGACYLALGDAEVDIEKIQVVED